MNVLLKSCKIKCVFMLWIHSKECQWAVGRGCEGPLLGGGFRGIVVVNRRYSSDLKVNL